MTSISYAGETNILTYDNDSLLTGIGNFNINRDAQNGLPITISNGTLNINRAFNSYGEIDQETGTIDNNTIYSYTARHN